MKITSLTGCHTNPQPADYNPLQFMFLLRRKGKLTRQLEGRLVRAESFMAGNIEISDLIHSHDCCLAGPLVAPFARDCTTWQQGGGG